MYANGYNRDKVMEMIRKYNNGTKSTEVGSIYQKMCKYETANGNRCFIGCFIPTAHQGLLATGSIEALIMKYPELMEYMPFDSENVLIAFQNSHDSSDINSSTYQVAESFLNGLESA